MKTRITSAMTALVLLAAMMFTQVLASDSGSNRTFTASGAITGGTLVKVTATANTVSAAGATDEAIGTALQTTATGAQVNVKLFRDVRTMPASGAITAGANVYPAASGQITATAGTGRRIGIALNATTNAGDLCDVVLMNPDDFTLATSGVTIKPAGLLSAQASSTGVGTGADTTEDTLYTYSMAGSSLVAVGDTIRVTAFGNTAANANNKTIKVYFGASSYTTGAAAANAKPWRITATIVKTGSNTQTITFSGNFNATELAPTTVAATETDTGAIVIKTTGTNGTASASDAVANGQLVEALKNH